MSINQIIENFIQNGAFIPYSVFRMISNESLKIKEDMRLSGQLPSIFIAGIENNKDNNDVTWKHFYSCILSAYFKENHFLAVYSPSFTTIKDHLSDFIKLNEENDIIICFCSSQKENDTNVYIEEEPFAFYNDITNARKSSIKVTRLLLINDKQQNGYEYDSVNINNNILFFYERINQNNPCIPPRSKASFLLPDDIETKRIQAGPITKQFRECGLNLEINHIVQDDDERTAQMIAVVFWNECTKAHGGDLTAALQELVRSTSSQGQPYAQTALQCALIPLWLLSAIHASNEHLNGYCQCFVDNSEIKNLQWAKVQQLVGEAWADKALDTIFNYLLTLDDSETGKIALYLDNMIKPLLARFKNNHIQQKTICLLRKVYKELDTIQQELDTKKDNLRRKEQKIGELESEKGDLEGKIAHLKSEKGDLEGKIAHLESEKGDLEGKIAHLKSEKGDLEGKIVWFYVTVLLSIIFSVLLLTYT